MIFEKNLWIGNKAVPERICDEIISFFKNKKTKKAVVGDSRSVNLNIRNSGVIFDDSPWINNLLMPFVREGNSANNWNFDIDDSETHQFTQYKKNQFYNWHVDSWGEPYNDPSSKNNKKIRKLSISLCLSHEKDYKGGDLKIAIPQIQDKELSYTFYKYEAARHKGSFILFPSYLHHTVEPVTSGTRYSLVTWFVGEPFR